MTVRIYTLNPEFPEFEFDIAAEVTKALKWTPTKRPVENVGNVADHVDRQPFTLSSNGFVAVTPISPRVVQIPVSTDPSVLIAMQGALEELANKEDLVTLACNVYTGPAVITSLIFAQGVQDGHSLRVDVSFSEIQIAITQTTQVNPSRLKPKVSKRSQSKGGQKASAQGGKKPESLLSKGATGLRNLVR